MKDFFVQNRGHLMNALKEKELVLLFSGSAPKSTADATYRFLPNKNFYYFTGLTKENFILGILKDKEGKTEGTLFIEKPDYDVEKWHGRKLSDTAVKEISGIENVKFLEDFDGWLNGLFYKDKVKSVYLDLEKNSPNEELGKAHRFAKTLYKNYPFLNIETMHPIVSDLRTIKSEFELGEMRKAIELTKNGLESILAVLKPGMYEYQMEATFAHRIRMDGGDGTSFDTIAASGGDAVILHYVDNEKKMEPNQLVLLDLGAQYKQYAADITRTYPISGVFSPRQKEIYDIVLKAQQAVIDMMKPGVPFEELNKTCKKVISEELLRIGVMKTEEDLGKYYYHGVSHYLGLDVHDLGDYEQTLKPGMVLTVEPGIYIAEEGIGIRIEDDVLITDAGRENLSSNILKTTEEIEAFMAGKKGI